MRKLFAIVLAALLLLGCTACGTQEKVDISGAETISDLAGAKIAAQSGTFHEEALAQIEGAKTSVYPDFTELLTALKSGAIDGYIAEEPTALAVCKTDDTIDYLPLKNNSTGFTATAADVGIAVGVKDGNALRDSIDAVLNTVTAEQKAQLMEQMVTLANGGTVDTLALSMDDATPTNGTLKVGMECAYEPFNWTETSNPSIGAVPISGEGKEGQYANGYDVQMARYIANQLGMKLEIYAYEFDSLIPGVDSGALDAIIAGMSPTAKREMQIDFTQTYYESNLVIVIKK